MVLYQEGPDVLDIVELGPENHSRDGLLGPSSVMVVYMDPLG